MTEIPPEQAALREQVRLARADRDQLRGQVLSLAAKWSDESYAAHGGYADALSECASELRQIAGPPA